MPAPRLWLLQRWLDTNVQADFSDAGYVFRSMAAAQVRIYMVFAAQARILIKNAGGYWLKQCRLSDFTIGHTFACCYSQLVNSVQPTAEGRTLYHMCVAHTANLIKIVLWQ